MLKRLLISLFFVVPTVINSDEISESKVFVENLGKEVVEKVSNSNISDATRHENFKRLYLSTFDNYYISRFVLGRYWKTLDKNLNKHSLLNPSINI